MIDCVSTLSAFSPPSELKDCNSNACRNFLVQEFSFILTGTDKNVWSFSGLILVLWVPQCYAKIILLPFLTLAQQFHKSFIAYRFLSQSWTELSLFSVTLFYSPYFKCSSPYCIFISSWTCLKKWTLFMKLDINSISL